jgi:hypothetical protein
MVDPNPVVVGGNLYLLWQSHGDAPAGEPTRLWGAAMTADGLSMAQGRQLLLSTEGWEQPIIEGPTMMPAPGGGFLLFYSTGYWSTALYKVGVAWCATPVAGCERLYANAVLATRGTMAGPGGPTVFQDRGGSWRMAFHAWTAPNVGYASSANAARALRFLSVTVPSGNRLPAVG